ncbi:MAG: DUF695 domain-containing protein [Agriterribacter sp.]
MEFIRKHFRKKETPIQSYTDFWNWFEINERSFFATVKTRKNIEKDFFEHLSSKLAMLKDGYFYLTGMLDENTVELILTSDGNVKNIVFVEELVTAAPFINGWKFTALKPALKMETLNIEMGGYEFNSSNLNFYSNDWSGYPDEVDITIVHDNLTKENKAAFINGTHIFLENFLGELDFTMNIDNIHIVGKHEAEKELIPILKLRDFLTWRQKEFIEKYQGMRYDTEKDEYSILEAQLENGNPLIAIINTDLLHWDCKASHPWIAEMTIKFENGNNGMPGSKDYQLMDTIEDELVTQMKDFDGYLNLGRQTANGERNIYFACKDFRKPSKVFHVIQHAYAGRFEIVFDIYKDKYWQSFERFNTL